MNNIHFYTSSRGPLGQHLHGRTGLSKGQKWNKYLNIFTVDKDQVISGIEDTSF